MSLAVRVIPCLDVNNGRVAKGVNFENLRDADDLVELTRRYGEEGVDELTFLDVTASKNDHDTMLDVVRRITSEVFIPLTVGGDVRSVEDVDQLLRAGADKVSVNTAAIARPELLSELSRCFSTQCVVLPVDAHRIPEGGMPQPSGFEVMMHGDSRSAGIDVVKWIRRGEEFRVSEILLNSMDDDGTKDGSGLELLGEVRATVDVPMTTSGGAGKTECLPPTVRAGTNAVLVAFISHFDEVNIAEAKEEIARKEIEVCQ